MDLVPVANLPKQSHFPLAGYYISVEAPSPGADCKAHGAKSPTARIRSTIIAHQKTTCQTIRILDSESVAYVAIS
jgi:hypothetical protein